MSLVDEIAESMQLASKKPSPSEVSPEILERLDTTVFQTNQLGFKVPASGANPAGVAIIDRCDAMTHDGQ